MDNVTIGSDVEVFLSFQGEPVSAVGLIDGDKEKPVEFLPGYGMQRDNVMAEFNIPPIQLGDKEGFAKALKTCLDHLRTIIPPTLDILIEPGVEMHEMDLQDPEACTFGCSPFFDIYKNLHDNQTNEERIYAEDVGNFRFAGGHIHIGWQGSCLAYSKATGVVYDQEEWDKKMLVAALCDKYLLLPSYFEDGNDLRRHYYGKPGKVRPKPYGVEYRSLSNYFVRSEDMMKKIMSRLMHITSLVNSIPPQEYLAFITGHCQPLVSQFVAANAETRKEMWQEIIEKEKVAEFA